MNTLRILVEKSSDAYGAYAIDFDGIYGMGSTVKEAKDNVIEGLKLYLETTPKRKLPAIFKGDYSIVFKYDMQSFLKFYTGIFTKTAIGRITGVNPELLHHYASGLKKPRTAQKTRIEKSIRQLGQELSMIEFV